MIMIIVIIKFMLEDKTEERTTGDICGQMEVQITQVRKFFKLSLCFY